MGHTGDHRRRPDPLTLLTQSMRRMATLSFDDITTGLENFANPSARGLLESLGKTRQEQVDALADMLRNSSEEDMAEMAQIFAEAMAKLSAERSAAEQRRPA
jgi:Mg/Co/Ni transporter MgtE